MDALTPAERRGALVVLLLLMLGTGRDLWLASRPLPVPAPTALTQVSEADTARRSPEPSAGARTTNGSPTVDLNLASAAELDALPGIGPVLAERIVAHRRRNGPFSNPEELLAVRGIGPRLLARLSPRVRVGPAAAPAAPDSQIRGR